MDQECNDFKTALRLQLLENGAGGPTDEISDDALVGIFDEEEQPGVYVLNISTAHALDAENLNSARDYFISQCVALEESGFDITRVKDTASHVQMSLSVIVFKECQICFDLIAPHFLVNAGECNDLFCMACIMEYFKFILQGGIQQRNYYPIACPACRSPLENDVCYRILSGTGRLHLLFSQLVIFKNYIKRLRYCSNPICSEPFDWVIEGPSSSNCEFTEGQVRVLCPNCKHETCAKCRTVWHAGRTCGLNMDNEALILAHESARQCPSCGHMIEKRSGDCNYVVCICGCGFCHNCGVKYENGSPTANNSHGKAGCNCGLFEGNYVPIVPREQVLAPEDNEFAGTHGSNGKVDLDACLNNRILGSLLPQTMIQAIEEWVCPYGDCNQNFGSTRSLEQHLAFTQKHVVYLCCNRPFYTHAKLTNHQVINCKKLHG